MNIMIPREIEQTIQNHLNKNKILLLKGPKKSGRSKLVLKALGREENVVQFSLSNKKIRAQFDEMSKDKLLTLFEGKSIVILHEAQYLAQLQQLIELILFDDLDLTLICICSFDPLLDEILQEALSSQGLILELTTPTFKELAQHEGIVNFEKNLDQRLIYGNYHLFIEDLDEVKKQLFERINLIVNEPLSAKDRINKSVQLKKLLQLLAFAIGEHISYHDIGQKCGLDNETVERYIALLEKAFVLISIPVYQTEQRYELKKAHQIYFYDNGIRNALIQNFNDLEIRNDAEALWRNWLIAERVKRAANKQEKIKTYFWLTHTRQQMDYIEEKSNGLFAYQMIWNKKQKRKVPLSFRNYYPQANTYQINRSSYWSFLNKD